jgi:hypothetical protein
MTEAEQRVEDAARIAALKQQRDGLLVQLQRLTQAPRDSDPSLLAHLDSLYNDLKREDRFASAICVRNARDRIIGLTTKASV